MKKVLKSVLLLGLLLCYNSCVDCKDNYEPQAPTVEPEEKVEEKVTVTTGAATNITNATATISGSVEITNSVESVIDIGFVYSSTDTIPSINTGILVLSNQSPDREFNVVLSHLTSGVTYYYRTYVYIDGKGYYGEVKTFTTEAVIVTTGTATNITNSTAIINGNVSNLIPDGISDVVIGVFYSHTIDGYVNRVLSESKSNGEFSVSLTGLNDGTTYYYRTYVYIDEKIYHGEVKTFTTEVVKVTTGSATNITSKSATLSGSVSNLAAGIANVEIGIVYSNTNTIPSIVNSIAVKSDSNINGEFSVSLTGLNSSDTYYYRTYVKIDYKVYYGEVSSFDTIDEITSGQEVDLGLSVKWASWNVGATSPEQYGGYYAWGETEEKSDYSESTYTHYNNGYINIGDNISGTQYDVATAKWGNGWRMPTKEECQELNDNCRFESYTYNDVAGVKVTGPNGNAIFLPAAGYRVGTSINFAGSSGFFWSGSLLESVSDGAWSLYINSDGGHDVYYYYRYYGRSVRPVR